MQCFPVLMLLVFAPCVLCLTLNDLFPFGSENGDTAMDKNDDGSTSDIPISTLFPFFNHQHSKLIVNTNGVITFLQSISTYTPNPFPIANNARMIAPFWADVDTTRGGTVWYRETTDDDLLNRASEEVRTYFPQFYRFKASWLFVATWDRVSFYGCTSSSCSKTNRFQVILITNGQHSFTIYNYEDIQWTTGTSSGGNSITGLGGTPAQVGFNAGDGIVFFTVNASRTHEIVNVTTMSNIDIPGKFAFRIDASDITDGGCNTEGDLTVTPRYGPMLGGQYLVLGGPCIEATATVKFNFLGLTQKYTCERKTEFSAVCITPLFRYTGDALLLVEIEDQGITTTFRGLYTVLNPADSKHRVYRRNSLDWFTGQQYISWDPDAAELQDNDTVDIHLFSLAEGSDQHLSWSSQVIHSGIPRLAGSAWISLQTNSFALAIRVTSASRKSGQSNRGIWSDIFPLALPPDQAYKFCENWLNNETQLPSLPTADVQPCPCTLDQALLDIVRFQPDPDCNMFSQTSIFSRTGNCLYRREASHCIRLASLGPQGVDNLCCYDRDNNLIDSRVREGGSLQRYHYSGGSGVLPYLANFYFDVLPFLHCCRYSQNVYQIIGSESSSVTNICPSYFTQRKFSSCINYDPPRPARTNGDPHITTLDGFRYTFNGIGEFTFVQTLNGSFLSQIRFEQFQKDNGDLVDASVCTSFVSQSPNTSAVVEVRLNSIRTADVLVNGDVIDFDESNAYQFQGVSIMQVSNNLTKREFIVSFTIIGIAFKAIASSNVLNILPVVGNNSLAGTLRGLLGDFDEDPNNDLRSPTGEMLLPNSTTEEIYDKFGLPWRITETVSLFTYEVGKSYNDYQKLSFRPAFTSPANVPPEVEELCGGDEECVFDYAVTGSAELAAETQQFTVIFNTSVGASYQIKNCEDLPTVHGGVWNATSTIEGSSATFSCYPGYEMEGASNIITCENGTWTDFGNFSCDVLVTTSTMDLSSFISTTLDIMSVSNTETVEETSIVSATTEIETETSTDITTTDANSITSTEDITYTLSISESTTTKSTSTLYSTTESTTESSTSDLPSTTESTTESSTSDLPSTTESITESSTSDVPSTTENTTESSTSELPSTTESTTESSTSGLPSTTESTTESSTLNMYPSTERIIASSTTSLPSTIKSYNSTVPTIESTTITPSTTAKITTDDSLPTFTTTEKADEKSTTSLHTSTKHITEVSTSTSSTAIENNTENPRPSSSVVTVNTEATTTSIITTVPPFRKSLQQVDDFLKENFKYIIIGGVFIVLCIVLVGVFICRRSSNNNEERIYEEVSIEGPQKSHNFSSAKFSSSQSYSSLSSVLGKLSYCEDYTIYKYEKDVNSSEM
ncbi:protein mesh-like [Ostrea edulis]|uniref:protein mesh-like n=1 Tax=Ostrea edulis TaxID=37623 RepID=UPI0024AFC796|nr:protein mesh-like [Ostrea edulis]